MKKKIALAVLAAASVFALSACSARAETNFSANWLSDPSAVHDPSFYERLEYGLSFTPEESSAFRMDIDAGNSSYVTETEALPGWSYGDTIYTNIYHIHTELTYSAVYTYTPAEGEEVRVAAFGGEYDTAESDADDPAQMVSDVYFRSKADGYNLEPIYSKTSYYSYSPAEMDSPDVSLYSYSVEVEYADDGDTATVRYTDNWADLSAEECAVSEHLTKTKLLSAEERTFGGLQRSYTAIDANQLAFAARGISFSAESSNTLTVFGGNANDMRVSIACSEIAEQHYAFTMDGQPVDSDISTARATFTMVSGGGQSGPVRAVYYAQRAEDGSNPYYCLPLRMDVPVGNAIGTLSYTLKDATHTK